MNHKHRSNRSATKGKNGKPRKSVPTERDVTKIYPLLAEYEVLSTPYIHAFVGGYYRGLRKHMSLQARAPNQWLELPAAQFDKPNADYNPFYFRLGIDGYKKHHRVETVKRAALRNFDHKWLECMFAASIELGVNVNPRYELIKWHEIFETLPKATREAKEPTMMPVTTDLWLKPDGKPFVIYDTEAEEGVFCVFEADNDTESDDSAYTNTIKFKVRAYLHILQERIYKKHFGSETFKVFFITVNPERQKQILNRIDSTIKEFDFDPALAEHLNVSYTRLFRTLETEEKPEPATGHMFTRDWKRAADFSDFNFTREEVI